MSVASRLKSRWHRVDPPKHDIASVDDLPAEAFVDLAYQVILGHQPDSHGLQFHAAQLSVGMKTRGQFVQELYESPEFTARKPASDYPAEEEFVRQTYPRVFGRQAVAAEVAYHAHKLSVGAMTRDRFVSELLESPEFAARRPVPDHDHPHDAEAEFVRLTYRVLLNREATPKEVAFNSAHIRAGKLTRGHLLYTLYNSQEFREKSWGDMDFWLAQHRARLLVAAQLPKAERIVDLGGSSEGNPAGAMIEYGYPYSFKSLSIVELPREQRHELYTDICGEYADVIQTPQGPVNYVYNSMSDLSAFGDGTIDLVYAGQSIEHVPVDEAKTVLREVHRVLRPGGHFCFDTPNRRVTILNFPDYVVDDHKYEYTHPEMTALLEGHGFAVREAKGMVLMDRSVRENRFDIKEVIGRDRLYDDIEDCFLLYYKAQKV